jgi:hypothetical protein
MVPDTPSGSYTYLGATGPGLGEVQWMGPLPGQKNQTPNLVMPRAATIEGRVTLPEGRAPAPDLSLLANTHDAMVMIHPYPAKIDAAGTFRISDLPPGVFSLHVTGLPEGWTMVPPRVTVAAGQTVKGIELKPQQGVSVSGTVLDADTGGPIAAVAVSAFDATDGRGGVVAGGNTSADGKFVLRAPAGRWRLRATPTFAGYTYANDNASEKRIEVVAGQEQSGHVLKLQRIKPVEGAAGIPAGAGAALAAPPEPRLSDEAQALLERIRVRRNAEPERGDFVEATTEMQLDAAGGEDERFAAVNIRGRRGDRFLDMRYLVGDRTYGDGTSRAIAVDKPDGWPAVSREWAEKLLQEAIPSNYTVVSDDHGWEGALDGGGALIGAGPMLSTMVSMRSAGFRKAEYDAAWKVSPFGANPFWEGKIVHDADHPGLVGLRCESPPFMGSNSRSQFVWWLDPARNDAVVEAFYRKYKEDGRTVESESRTTYLETEQMAGGTVRGTRWQVKTTVPGTAGPREQRTEYRLQHLKGIDLEERLFTDPVERLRLKRR